MDKCGWSNREVDKRISLIVGKRIHFVGIYVIFGINTNKLVNDNWMLLTTHYICCTQHCRLTINFDLEYQLSIFS